jgi:hypothetical protein
MANFSWTSSKSNVTNPTKANKPILNEKNSNSVVAYLDNVNIGVFNSFGYLTNSSNFNKDISEFIKSLDAHFRDMNSRLVNLENN